MIESPGRSQSAVEAEAITFAYGDRRALDDVSFEVTAASIFGFLGPNGGGKTTLFRLLSTLVAVQAGSLRVFGSELATEAHMVRLQIGVVFQMPSLDPQLTVLENLRYQGYLYGLKGRELEQRAISLLERFHLQDRQGERAGKLSGGLQRRVEISKALLHRPRLLLLDEPSTGLDPGARRDLWNMLEELRDVHDVTVLLTTHFIEEGDRCDRVALLDSGHIVASGTPEALKGQIGGDVVTVASGTPGRLAEQLRNRLGIEVSLHDEVLRFEHPKAHELVGELAELAPGQIEALTISRPTLEDVFLQRTGHGLWENRT